MVAVQVTVIRSKATKRVLYVEAGKDFVDLLLSFLFLPVGIVAARLPADASLVGMTSIYKSVGALANYLNVPKESVLWPTVSLQSKDCVAIPAGQLLGIQVASQPASVERFFSCLCGALSSRVGISCPVCKMTMTTPVHIPALGLTTGPGIAKDYPYIVTDNLEITPTSAAKCFDLLQSMNVSSLDDLERSSVQVAPTQALQLLAAAFSSRTALTDVFK